MSNIKNGLSKILKIVPHAIYNSIMPAILFIPYYHIISNEKESHIKHLYPHKTIKQFQSDIDYLLKNFTPATLNDFLAFDEHYKVLRSKTLLLTFDDGFREMHDIVAPILLQKGIPATFFISSSFIDNGNLCYQHKASILVEHLLQKNISSTVQKKIENILLQKNIQTASLTNAILSVKYQQRNLMDQIAEQLAIDFNDYLKTNKPYLTSEQINKMITHGFTFGAHSIDHPLYADLTLEEQLRQTIESVLFVRKTFNLHYGAFAFPHSDYGVSKKYFDEIAKSQLIDISFGTAGMIDDCASNHYQRFSLEKPLVPAKNILSLQYAKRLWRTIKRSNTMIR